MKRFLKIVSVPLVSLLFLVALLLPTVYEVAPVQAQGGVTVFSNLRISNFFRLQKRTTIEVSMNGTLNPTGSYQVISASVGSAVSLSGADITVKPAGSVLVLVNTGGQTITFTETGTLRSAGNIALGQYDSATLLSDGTNWTQISGSNN